MDIFESTLKNINYPILIWKKNTKNKYVCYYTNGKIDKVKIKTHLNKYLSTKEKHIAVRYDEFFLQKTYLIIKDNDFHITLNYLDEDTFFEFHSLMEDSILLSTISHKIRLPLTNIMGILTLIDTSKMNSENKKYLNIIKESSCLITNIVNDIIDILNLQQNKVKLEYDHININKLLKYCINATADTKKKIQIIININKNVPKMIISDNNKLTQIIINILSNSFKFTECGNITISVSVQNVEKKQNLNDSYDILFTIKDTGCGIASQQKINIENMLTETSWTNKYVDGFGLIICKNLCELFGGKLWFKSEMDIGSIFYFNIKCNGLKNV